MALRKSFSQFNLKFVEQGTAKAELVSDMTPLMSQVVVLCVFAVLVHFSSGRTRPLKLMKRNTYLRAQHLKPVWEDSNGCVDERDDCIWIVEVHNNDKAAIEDYCDTWKNSEAIQQCRKTCNLCSKAPHPPQVPQTEKPETTKSTVKTTKEKPTEKPTAAPKATQSTGETLTGFQKDCLRAHNEFRFNHGVPPLKWSAKLTRDAQVWANHLADTSSFDHDPTARAKDQGENLSYVWPAKRLCDYGERSEDCFSCREFVEDWYNEYKDYDYNKGRAKTSDKVVTHFTQIIWKSTRELGMSAAVGKDGSLKVVARYSPVGNWLNEFRENVPPPVAP